MLALPAIHEAWTRAVAFSVTMTFRAIHGFTGLAFEMKGALCRTDGDFHTKRFLYIPRADTPRQ